MTARIKVLIVEDDSLIAMDLEDELSERGFKIIGCSENVSQARTALTNHPDAVAVLDMHLKRENTFALARDLKVQGAPFFFLSGNESSALPVSLKDSDVIMKPVAIEAVVELIRAKAGERKKG